MVFMLAVLAVAIYAIVVALPLRQRVVLHVAFAAPKSLAQAAMGSSALIILAGALHFLLATSASPPLLFALLVVLTLLASAAAFGLTFAPAIYLAATGKELLVETHDATGRPGSDKTSVQGGGGGAGTMNQTSAGYSVEAEKESLMDSIDSLARKEAQLREQAKLKGVKGVVASVRDEEVPRSSPRIPPPPPGGDRHCSSAICATASPCSSPQGAHDRVAAQAPPR